MIIMFTIFTLRVSAAISGTKITMMTGFSPWNHS